MAGSGDSGDHDDLPNLDDDDDGNESTVAMDAPSFGAGMPLPISNPPPAAAAPAPAAPAPVPASARSPAAAAARPAAGAPAAGPPRPAFAGAPPRPPGAAGARSVGKSTVIGLAPPGARPAPAAAAAAPTPPAPRTPVSTRIPAVPAPPAPAPAPAAAPPPPDDDDIGGGATMASEPGAMAGFAGSYPLDPSPAAKEKEPEKKGGEENEAATVTVPKDVLDRVRANPKAVLEEEKEKRIVPRIVHDEDADGGDETKAVPREDLLRPQLPHVVLGGGATGPDASARDDATVALAPQSNDAAALSNIGASIGDALQHPPPPDGGAFPSVQGFPAPSYGGPGQQPQPQLSPSYMGPGPHMGMPPPNMPTAQQQQHQHQQWSSGHVQAAPHPHGGMPPYAGGPMMQPQQGGFPRSQVPTNWSPLQAPPAKSRVSGQMILLFVVGFVCLAIFVTGIVLFMTTKF